MATTARRRGGDPNDPLAVRLLYSPQSPTPPQHAFLMLGELEVLEALYGGAGGGGKSSAMLMDALRYVDVPGYAALILRRTFMELDGPGALMSRSREWLAGTDARWNEQRFRWTFPAGSTLSFGYLQAANDVYQYAGREYQFIGFDELTTFRANDYRFLFTRLRRPSMPDADEPLPEDPDARRRREEARKHAAALADVPLRMRAASNPGGPGHAWVKARFIDKEVDEDDPKDTPERARRRIFIPAKMTDNPHLDQDSYLESLNQVDPTLRARILDGDWDVVEGDQVYNSLAIAAARALGDELDRELEAGTIAPPAGGYLAIGLDWGEHAHALIGWPLPGGGLYVVGEQVGEGEEPGQFAYDVFGGPAPELEARGGTARPGQEGYAPGILDTVVELGRRPRPADWVDPATLGPRGIKLALRPAAARHGALPPTGDPLRLVLEHRYDAAGIQPMRTYLTRVRRRHPAARAFPVQFGAPAARSGTVPQVRSLKAETIGHLRRMVDRSLRRHQGDDGVAGYLAIGRRAPVLRRQLPALTWADREAGKIEKGDDHGPDALIALDAPLAIRHR